MLNETKEVFKVLDQIAKNHMNAIPKIFYNHRTYDFVFLKDIATLYSKLSKKTLNLDWFLKNCYSKENPFIIYPVVKPSNGKGYSILVSRDSSSNNAALVQEMTKTITADLTKNNPLRVKTVRSKNNSSDESDVFVIGNQSKVKNIKQENNSFWSERDGLFSNELSKPIKLNSNSSHPNLEIKGKQETSLVTSQPQKNSKQTTSVMWLDSSNDSELEILMSVKPQSEASNPQKETKALHCDFSDSEEHITSTRFKSPLQIATTTSNDQLFQIKSKLISAFDDYPVISMDNFRIAFCAKNGIMFDYTKYPCPIPHHPHGNLSKFLNCFHELLELKTLRKLYILNKTQRIGNLSKARISAYIKPEDDPLYLLCSEALLTSILTTKTTLQLDDFVDLFTLVYKNPIKILCKSLPPHQFINNLRSPNLILVKKGEIYNLTVTPLRCESYVEWQPNNYHRKIIEIEQSILNGKEITDEFKGQFLVFEDRVPSNLMAIANCNVPRILQIKITDDLKDLNYEGAWIYLNSNLNFGNTKAFFIE